VAKTLNFDFLPLGTAITKLIANSDGGKDPEFWQRKCRMILNQLEEPKNYPFICEYRSGYWAMPEISITVDSRDFIRWAKEEKLPVASDELLAEWGLLGVATIPSLEAVMGLFKAHGVSLKGHKTAATAAHEVVQLLRKVLSLGIDPHKTSDGDMEKASSALGWKPAGKGKEVWGYATKCKLLRHKLK